LQAKNCLRFSLKFFVACSKALLHFFCPHFAYLHELPLLYFVNLLMDPFLDKGLCIQRFARLYKHWVSFRFQVHGSNASFLEQQQ
jgi:hypothetical protein